MVYIAPMSELANFFILVPLYIYPSPGAWQPLYDGISNYTNLDFTVIIAPGNGPGYSPYPDSNWQTAISNLNSFSNVKTLGYVDCAFGSNNASNIEMDIDIYNDWAIYTDADIHVDGIWFESAPSEDSWLAYTEQITEYVKATMVKGNLTFLNIGTAPNQTFYDLASIDYINVFENTFKTDGYGDTTAADVIPTRTAYTKYDYTKSTVIVHDYPESVTQIKHDIENFAEFNLAGLFFTSETGFDKFSAIWGDLLYWASKIISDDIECYDTGYYGCYYA